MQNLQFERAAAGQNFAIVISHVEPGSQCEKVQLLLCLCSSAAIASSQGLQRMVRVEGIEDPKTMYLP